MAEVTPKQVITAADAADLSSLKAYLDGIGYTVGGQTVTRADDDGSLTVTITYPSWAL